MKAENGSMSAKDATTDVLDGGADRETEMGYQTTVMYGCYQQHLADYAREQALELRQIEKQRKKEDKKRTDELMHRTYRGKWTTRLINASSFVWQHTFARIGEDWVFLALLGIIVAVISYTMDYAIIMCVSARRWYYDALSDVLFAQYIVWIGISLIFVIFSVGFVSLVAPQAVGSGIPEMKTIMRGVHVKEYLTFRTGVAKVVGLVTALGSGLPLGKEGPLVHIASIVATMLSKMVTSFKGIYENESRNSEMLAAACAVGLAVNFAAPIGGVLFSIEVTSVYFAIRNYWRGFFSAVFGALTNRLLAYWFKREESITATYRTDFRIDFPYHPQELIIFVLMGVIGGLSGAFYVLCHRKYVLFMRNNKTISNFLKMNRFIYPTIVSIIVTSLYFPQGIGDYLLAKLTTREQIIQLFSNFTWYDAELGRLGVEEKETVAYWTHDGSTHIILTLLTYMVGTYFLAILATTIPVPNGSMFPIFRIGAAFGRLIGELMHRWVLGEGMIGSMLTAPVLPGGYAIVGAAAFSAGVTHTISVSIVICEMTGHIRHVIPILIAVLVSNAVSSSLQPSFYESLIMIKKLPYLPDIVSSNSGAHNIYVEDFMVRNIKYIWDGMTFEDLRKTIMDGKRIRAFPLVDSPHSMILLGSIQRFELIKLIENQIGRERRLQEAVKMHREQRIRQYEESMKSCKRSSGSSSPRRVSLSVSTKPKSLLKFLAEKNKSLPASLRQAEPKKLFEAVQVLEEEEPPVLNNRMERQLPVCEIVNEVPAMGKAGEAEPDVKRILRFEVRKSPEIDGYAAQPTGKKPVNSRFSVTKVSEEAQQDQQPVHSSVSPNEGKQFPSSNGIATSATNPSNPALNKPGTKDSVTIQIDDDFPSEIRPRAQSFSTPKKSILKKKPAASFEVPELEPSSHYATVTGTEGGRFRQAVDNLIRKSASIKAEGMSNGSLSSIANLNKKANVTIDMTPEEQKKWEEREMQKPVDLKGSRVDPAPFQLVEKTSLLKVHSMFSMMALNHAYVTAIGKLIGVVSLKELREAIEDVNSRGHLHHNNKTHDVDSADPASTNLDKDRLKYRNGTPPPNFSAGQTRASAKEDGNCDSDSDEAMDFLGPGRLSIEDPQERSYGPKTATSDDVENAISKNYETQEGSDAERQNLLVFKSGAE